MKKLAVALLFFVTTTTAFAFSAKKSTNPTDFPIVVHVVFSHYSSDYQHLDAVIDGQEVELQRLGSGVLNLGDYKAQRITTYADLAEGTSSFIPKHSNPSDTFIVYRFLMPDNSIREYELVGLGPKADSSATTPTNP